MEIIYLSYWGIDEGLTQATVLPHLSILEKYDSISKIHFVTIERSGNYKTIIDTVKIKHKPLFSDNKGNVLLTKTDDFIKLPNHIGQIINHNSIRFLLCRSSMAGSIGYLIYKKYKIPFVVESFEPHADYMLESGVWKKYDPRYILQKYWENKQQKKATLLISVAKNYTNYLATQDINTNKLETVPCCVNIDDFIFSEEKRKKIRLQYSITGVTGIYVGKFGGLYYDDEAFLLFKKAYDTYPNFKLIILSPNDKQQVINSCIKAGISIESVLVTSVKHNEVADYLSAADFAFATYRSGNFKKYLSPIKIGEYWANGLPVILTEGVGDDSKIIEHTSEAGANINFDNKESIDNAFYKIQLILNQVDYREKVQKLAVKYRSFAICEEVYDKMIQHFENN